MEIGDMKFFTKKARVTPWLKKDLNFFFFPYYSNTTEITKNLINDVDRHKYI